MNIRMFYDYTLFACAFIYIFNGLFLILSKVPRQKFYKSYRLSRQLLGVSMLVLGVGNMVSSITLQHQGSLLENAVFNIIVCYIACILMSYAMMNLFLHKYICRRQVVCDLKGFVLTVAFAVASTLSDGYLLTPVLLCCAVALLLTFIIHFIIKLKKTCRSTRQQMKNYYPKRLHHFSTWILHSNFLLVMLGLPVLLMAFMPLLVNMFFVLTACFGFIYVFFSYQNYLYYFGDVEKALMVAEINQPQQKVERISKAETQLITDESQQRLQLWLSQKMYLKQDVTIERMATALGTNRSYLSQFINRMYHYNFSDWINRLRIHDAKILLIKQSDVSMEEIALSVGFSSGSYFTKMFNKIEGVTPTRWREMIENLNDEKTEI